MLEKINLTWLLTHSSHPWVIPDLNAITAREELQKALNTLIDDYNERQRRCDTCKHSDLNADEYACSSKCLRNQRHPHWEPRDPAPETESIPEPPEGAQWWNTDYVPGRTDFGEYYRVNGCVIQVHYAGHAWEKSWRKGLVGKSSSPATATEALRQVAEREGWEWVGDGPKPEPVPEPPAEFVPEGARWRTLAGTYYRSYGNRVEWYKECEWATASSYLLLGVYPSATAAKYALDGFAAARGWTRVNG